MNKSLLTQDRVLMPETKNQFHWSVLLMSLIGINYNNGMGN